MSRRKDDTLTAYLVRDAPTDVVHGAPPWSSGVAENSPGTPTPGPGEAGGQERAGDRPPRRSTVRPRPERSLARASDAERDLTGFDDRPDRGSYRPLESDRDPPSWPPPPLTADEPVEQLVHDLCASSPGEEASAIAELLTLGERALPVLCRRFPGPAWVDPALSPRELPDARLAAPVSAALVAFGDAAVPHVGRLLASSRPFVRHHAALVAASLRHSDLLEPLGQMALHPEQTSRALAIGALRGFPRGPSFDRLLTSLRLAAAGQLTRQAWRARSIAALTRLRDADSVPVLISLLADRDRSIARAAHIALRVLTGHDFGGMRQPWNRWLGANEGRARVDWLLDGVADRRPEVRYVACLELSMETGQPWVLVEDASHEEYLALQDRYRAWLRARGHVGRPARRQGPPKGSRQ